MTRLLWFMVPTALAVGTMTLWWAPALSPRQAPAVVLAAGCAVAAHRFSAITRWLGLGQSLMGAIQAFSWVVVGPWAALLACLAPFVLPRRRLPVVQTYNTASFVVMSCAGWWGFHAAGGDLLWEAQHPAWDLGVPVAVGALVQLLTNVLLIVPGLALIRGHRLPALVRDATGVLRAGWANQVMGAVVLALLAWAIKPHGVGLVLAAVPLMVHMAVVNTIQTAEVGQTRALRTLTRAAQTSDPYVELHGARVAEYAKEIGRHLRLGPHQMESLDLAARLHDIGFVALPPEAGDRELGHGTQGARMLEGLPFLDAAADLIRHSHDTAEEPEAPGETHPVELRVLQVADAVDALVAERPDLDVDGLCDLLAADAAYDPRVVAALRSARPVLRAPEMPLEDRPPWWRHDLPAGLRGAS
ncbi:HD domain-containing protein [Kytococcus sedentarius]|uniref:HD-GYP domain-containing protein n=1 Tax=Kytococcus sedentarius TaxID=1276 RepID=UPI0035BC0442